ncbi:MAG: pantoate--beta-alanine ligase [Acidobacteria bacterium]|nr:pantoate--beta-alanine ligase [Acidobacteriota bacterium]
MRLVHTIEEMREQSRAARAKAGHLALVPTMGALHQGHLSLVRAAGARASAVAVSIFVNPTQFAPGEDFAVYPRTLAADLKALEAEGVELVFAPSVDEMYASNNLTWVVVEGLSERLCGASRPGHFRGVSTVVLKLLHIITPDSAFFGQKDALQVAIIRRMVRDLNLATTIEVCPIVRDPDGLALSSRNRYLTPEDRQSALVLSRSLAQAEKLFKGGERRSDRLIQAAKQAFAREPRARLDYFEIVDLDTIEPVPTITQPVLIAVAAFLGRTRLIDNLILTP